MAARRNVRRAATMVGLAAALQLAVAGTVRADEWSDCVRRAASANLEAKTQFQRGFRDLVVRDHAEFEDLAAINMNLQIKLAESRRSAYEYLLRYDRDRIDTANGVSRFSNFDWSDEDTELFKRESETYRILEEQVFALKEANNGHPDWPKSRRHVRSGLSASRDYKALLDRLQARLKDVEATLSRCRRD